MRREKLGEEQRVRKLRWSILRKCSGESACVLAKGFLEKSGVEERKSCLISLEVFS